MKHGEYWMGLANEVFWIGIGNKLNTERSVAVVLNVQRSDTLSRRGILTGRGYVGIFPGQEILKKKISEKMSIPHLPLVLEI